MNEYLSKKIKIISFVSIIMVVYLHAFNLTTKFANETKVLEKIDLNSFMQHFISNGATRVAVPLFFLMSGYLFFINLNPTINNFIIKYRKRFFSLVIPFMFWSLWGLLLLFLLQSVPFSKSFFSGGLVKNYSSIKIVDTIFIHPIPYQLWFLIDLIKYIIICPMIYIYVSKFSYYSLIPFIPIWFFDVDMIVVNSEGISFFIIGCLLAIKKIDVSLSKLKKKEVSIITFAWLSVLVIKTYLSLHDVYFAVYFLKISIVIGILAAWKIYDMLSTKETEKTNIFKLTEYTFFIYASHEPILTIVKKVMIKLIGMSSYANLAIYLVSPIITIGFVTIIAIFLKRYMKPLYKIITGNRTITANQQHKEIYYKHFANEGI